MRVHILDPQLDFADGHYATYDAAIVAEFSRRGIETFVYGSTKRVASVPSGLDAEPLFTRGLFEEVASDPLAWALENFIQLGDELHASLATLGSERFRQGDLALFPNVIQYQINGIRDWIMELAAERRPTLVLKQSYLTHAMPYLQRRPNREMIPLLFRYSMRRLAADHPRTRFASDTEEMVKQFGELTGLPIHLLPLPLIMPEQPTQPAGGPRATVAYLGHASMLKGFHLLPEVVKRVSADAESPHFTIQCYGEGQLCGMARNALAQVPADRLTLIDGAIDADAYGRLLGGADIVLLPYAREFYGWASSGIFAQAMSLGKVIVASQGTWPAEQLEKFGGGGVIIKTLDAGGVADAVRAAVRALPRLRERAAAAAAAWRAQHCPARFIDRLLELAA